MMFVFFFADEGEVPNYYLGEAERSQSEQFLCNKRRREELEYCN